MLANEQCCLGTCHNHVIVMSSSSSSFHLSLLFYIILVLEAGFTNICSLVLLKFPLFPASRRAHLEYISSVIACLDGGCVRFSISSDKLYSFLNPLFSVSLQPCFTSVSSLSLKFHFLGWWWWRWKLIKILNTQPSGVFKEECWERWIIELTQEKEALKCIHLKIIFGRPLKIRALTEW